MTFPHLNEDFTVGLLGKLICCGPEFRETISCRTRCHQPTVWLLCGGKCPPTASYTQYVAAKGKYLFPCGRRKVNLHF